MTDVELVSLNQGLLIEKLRAAVEIVRMGVGAPPAPQDSLRGIAARFLIQLFEEEMKSAKS